VSSPSAAARSAALASAPACRVVLDDAERAAHFAVRRAVFCAEQGLFGGTDDRDERDADPATLHVVGLQGATIAGTVRLYPLDGGGRWKGDRLAVLPPFRHTSLGATLVHFAVRSAGERGGVVMVAMIQLPNVRFFQALGWRRDGGVTPFHGRDHQPMAIALSAG
jgi:putative N-acetyltransferase (TIGR04045 family)